MIEPLFRVDAKSLGVLEWDSVRQQLESRARTPLGKNFCLAWAPGSLSREAAARQARAVLDLNDLKARLGHSLPLNDIPNVGDVLQRISRSGSISVEEFATLVRAHKAAQGLHHFLQRFAAAQRDLLERLSGIDLIEDWSRRHFPLLDAKGEIVDSASDDLRALRKLREDLNRKIQEKLQEFLSNPKITEVMQDFYITVRDGRYVIPVKNSFRSRVPGIIHDVSNTESTLFIEPQDVVEWNNQLKIAEKEIQREIERILAQVVGDTQRYVPAFRSNQKILAIADFLAAAADLAGDWGGDVTVAEWDEGAEPRFDRLRHPTLALHRKMVANDIGWKRGLVLSGPNTGGKTVLLKSVGCAFLLAWAGLPIPATAVQLPSDCAGLFADIGDDQNLEQDLSTFSAHLKILGEVLRTARPGDLVLVDEIATGTSPEEGEPLAQAFLEKLLQDEVRFLITTHYRGLKHFAMSDDRVRIAAMAFDSRTRAPTFEIVLDVPGDSSAIEAAEKMGIPSDVLERARALRGLVSEDLSKAIGRLEDARNRLNGKEQELEATVERARQDSERARAKIAEYEARQREGLANESREVLRKFQSLRDELAQAVKGAHQTDLSGGATSLFTRIADAADSVRHVIDDARAGQGPLPTVGDEEIVANALVEVDGLGLGTILETPKDPSSPKTLVLVQVGDIKTRVVRTRLKRPPNERVRQFSANKTASAAARDRREAGARSASAGGASAGNLICDLRGKSVEDAMRRLNIVLNELFHDEHAVITCIHGHGSDRLKDSIRDYLTRERGDVLFRSGSWPGEGGDGVTIIERRG
jgi:DNA mismatch repair protein MutS2